MSLIVVGLNHRTVPVDLLERMAVPPDSLRKALHALSEREHLLEVAVLSTCNRTEVYARCTRFHAAVGDVADFLAEHSGAAHDDFTPHLYTYYDDAAVAHLFSVAAGLDSMIVGEHEILGQVRDAWRAARDEGAAPQFLARVFAHAVASGRRVRAETEIGRHPVSISSAAVNVASEHLGGFDGCRVLMLGAGSMGSGIAGALAGRGVVDLCILNRTPERARTAAARSGGRGEPLDRLGAELEAVDVVFGSTAAPDVLVEREVVEAAMARRPDRPLLVVDVALPRDVDPGVGEVPGVTLLDLDDLKGFAARSTERRRREITRVREILDQEIARYRDELRAREVAPVIAALRERAEGVRRDELERFRGALDALDPQARASVDALTRGLVNKLLHEPSVRLKDAASRDLGDLYTDALLALFDLPDPEVG